MLGLDFKQANQRPALKNRQAFVTCASNRKYQKKRTGFCRISSLVCHFAQKLIFDLAIFGHSGLKLAVAAPKKIHVYRTKFLKRPSHNYSTAIRQTDYYSL